MAASGLVRGWPQSAFPADITTKGPSAESKIPEALCLSSLSFLIEIMLTALLNSEVYKDEPLHKYKISYLLQ